jgi:hypothetical protein
MGRRSWVLLLVVSTFTIVALQRAQDCTRTHSDEFVNTR